MVRVGPSVLWVPELYNAYYNTEVRCLIGYNIFIKTNQNELSIKKKSDHQWPCVRDFWGGRDRRGERDDPDS